jgi:hypothetical protein
VRQTCLTHRLTPLNPRDMHSDPRTGIQNIREILQVRLACHFAEEDFQALKLGRMGLRLNDCGLFRGSAAAC